MWGSNHPEDLSSSVRDLELLSSQNQLSDCEQRLGYSQIEQTNAERSSLNQDGPFGAFEPKEFASEVSSVPATVMQLRMPTIPGNVSIAA